VKQKTLIFYFVVSCLLICKCSYSQEPSQQQPPPPKEDKNFWDKVYIGGNFGLQFGSVTVIDVAPQIGYRVTEKFVPGIGITYIYYNYRDPYYHTRTETNIYGGSIFGKYFFTPNLFAHVEYEQLSMEVYKFNGSTFSLARAWVPSMFVGGGYNQPLGSRGFIQLMILFEVLQDRNSLYYRNNPVVRIGFGF